MPPVPQLLSPAVCPALSTFRTAAALQRHQEWVSQPAAQIPGLVQAAGFQLVGGVIRADHSATQAYVARREGQTVVSFRGSRGEDIDETLLNVLTDVRVRRVKPVALISGKAARRLRVHEGFYQDYLEVRQRICEAVAQNPGDHVYCTGFSLGSALANLAALDLVVNAKRAVTYHGMGTPRVGNQPFKQLFNRQVTQALRAVFTLDPVPRVPLYWGDQLGFLHVGRLLELQADGTPVPADKIEGRPLDAHEHLDDHNRDKYAAMIAGFIAKFEADAGTLEAAEGPRPLWAAAKAEQASLRRFGL